MLRQFIEDKRGATAIEYGMIAAVLSLAIVGGVGEVQSQIMLEWTDINSTTNQALNKN